MHHYFPSENAKLRGLFTTYNINYMCEIIHVSLVNPYLAREKIGPLEENAFLVYKRMLHIRFANIK